MFTKLGVIGCVPLAIAAVHVSGQAPIHSEAVDPTFEFHYEGILGTSLDLRVRAQDVTSAERAEAAALAEFDRQDRILSTWRADSEVSRWAGTRFVPVVVSPELFRVLGQFDSWREKTSGALDPSVEAAARLWRTASAEGRTATQAELAQAIEAIQQPHWSLNSAGHTATRLTDVPLAFASFVKSSITSAAADAALKSGATGVMLNVGGDVVVRGALAQVVSVADPGNSAENSPALEHLLVRNRAVATSGSYRRGLDVAQSLSVRAHELSHILDPHTATPTGHILSSTVVAADAETAGALATAFSVLSVEESEQLASSFPGVDYLLITRDGRSIRSSGLDRYASAPGLHTVSYAIPAPPKVDSKTTAGMWNSNFELNIALDVARVDDVRAKRPYVAVWIEDADHFPVRTLALWVEKARWIPDLKEWYKDEQIRKMAAGNDLSRTVSSATRPPGQYSLKWDGKDNEGKAVKSGVYSVVIEASREHGTYQVERHELNFNGQPQQHAFPSGKELGAVALDYRKR